eukprot:1156093-Pelagomonas_calceolata.AAC.1
MDSTLHVLSSCQCPAVRDMVTERHSIVSRMIWKVVSEGSYGSNLLQMDVGSADRLVQDDLHITERVPNHVIPPYLLTLAFLIKIDAPPAALMLSCMRRNEEVTSNTTPAKQFHELNIQNRQIHLTEIKYCEDTRPGAQLEASQQQHSELCKQLQGTETTLHTILLVLSSPLPQVYAPPEDAAKIVMHATFVPWDVDAQPGVPPREDLRFYARGLFASPLLTNINGSWASYLGTVKWAAYASLALVHSFMDYPVRHLSKGRWGRGSKLVLVQKATSWHLHRAGLISWKYNVVGVSKVSNLRFLHMSPAYRLAAKVQLVSANPQAYDADLAKKLWELSAEYAGIQNLDLLEEVGIQPKRQLKPSPQVQKMRLLW